MKELPSDPVPYTPPPDRWYERHVHAPGSAAEAMRTLIAMRLTVDERLGLNAKKQYVFRPVVAVMLAKFVKKNEGNVMEVWRTLCLSLRGDEDPEKAFLRLLATASDVKS